MPNWKPCVHSVQPRELYLPATVKTGVPLLGSQAASRARIFSPASSNTRAVFFESLAGVREALIFMKEDVQETMNRADCTNVFPLRAELAGPSAAE